MQPLQTLASMQRSTAGCRAPEKAHIQTHAGSAVQRLRLESTPGPICPLSQPQDHEDLPVSLASSIDGSKVHPQPLLLCLAGDLQHPGRRIGVHWQAPHTRHRPEIRPQLPGSPADRAIVDDLPPLAHQHQLIECLQPQTEHLRCVPGWFPFMLNLNVLSLLTSQ